MLEGTNVPQALCCRLGGFSRPFSERLPCRLTPWGCCSHLAERGLQVLERGPG